MDYIDWIFIYCDENLNIYILVTYNKQEEFLS